MVQSEWPSMGNCQHQSDIPTPAASNPPCIIHCGGRELGAMNDRDQYQAKFFNMNLLQSFLQEKAILSPSQCPGHGYGARH